MRSFIFVTLLGLAPLSWSQQLSNYGKSGPPAILATDEGYIATEAQRREAQHPCYNDSRVLPSKKKMNKALQDYMDASKDRMKALQRFNQATTEYEIQVEECKNNPPTG